MFSMACTAKSIILRLCSLENNQRASALCFPYLESAFLVAVKKETTFFEVCKRTYFEKRTSLIVKWCVDLLGSVVQIRELCKIMYMCRASFHTDTVQVVGHVKINVHELKKGISFLFEAGERRLCLLG